MSSVTVTTTSSNANAGATSTHALAGHYNLAVGYLRAFITLLVLALSGFSDPRPPRNPRLLLSSPYSDPCRSV
jgi:hypothetical protein